MHYHARLVLYMHYIACYALLAGMNSARYQLNQLCIAPVMNKTDDE